MNTFICELCSKQFKRKSSKGRPSRFCSQKCYHRWRKDNRITSGQFKSGDKPWNKGVKGIHLSPSTQFKKGHVSSRRLHIGAVTVRKHKGDNPRQWRKIGNPDKWIPNSHFVWIDAGGTIPDGFVIHHLNGDSMNDDINNLSLVTRGAHINIHRHEFEETRLVAANASKSKSKS